MKKDGRKWISALVAAIMTMSLMGTSAFSGPWSETFTTATLNTVPAGSGLVYGNIYPEEGVTSVTPVTGVGMKAANDVAIKVASKGVVYPDTLKAKANFTNPNINKDFTDVNNLTSADIVHLSVEMMTEDFYVGKTMIMKVDSVLSTDTATKYDRQDPNAALIDMRTDGTIRFLGSTSPTINYALGQWYKFDIFLYGYSNKADLYINGRLAIENFTYQPKGGQADSVLTAVRLMRPNYTVAVKSGSEYWPATMYVDNMYCNVVSAKPTLTETNLTALTDFSYGANADEQNYKAPTTNSYTMINQDFNFGNFKEKSKISVVGTGVMNFTYEKGKFGKSPDDASLHISNPQQYWDPVAEAAYNTNGYLRVEPLLKVGNSELLLQANDQFRLSVSFALDSASRGNKAFSTVFNGLAAADRPNIDAISVAGDGSSVKVFGQTLTGVKLRLGTWYRFDLVCTVGTEGVSSNMADLYINGTKKTASPVAFQAKAGTANVYSAVQKFVFRPGYSATTTGTTATMKNTSGTDVTVKEYKDDGGLYMDDIFYQVYRGGTGIGDPSCVLTHTDSTINSIIKPGIIAPTPYNLTVESFLAGASATNAKNVYVTDSSGANVTTGSLLGKTVVVTPLYGGNIYYTVAEYDTILSTDFNYTLAANTKPTGFTGYSKFYDGTHYPWHTSSNDGGVGAKDASDKAFFIKTSNFDNVNPDTTYYKGAIGDPFIDYTTTTDYSETLTLETNLLATGKNHDNVVSAGINGIATENLKEVFNLRANGDISLNGTAVGKWTEGRWYNFAATFKYNTNLADIYMNGELILSDTPLTNLKDSTGTATATTISSVKRMKLNVSYGTPSAGQTYSGTLGIDNVRLYTGAYNTSNEDVSFTVNNYQFDQAAKKIYIYEYQDLSEFISNIENVTGNSELLVYTDSSLQSLQDSYVTGGSVLVVRSVSGKTIEYYDIIDSSSIAGIAASDYSYSDTTVSYVANGTPVSVLKSKITPEVNNTMKVLNDQEQEVDDSAIVTDGMKLKLIAGNGADYKLYTIDVLNAVTEGFESWTDKKYDILNVGISPIIPSPWTSGGFPLAEVGYSMIDDVETLPSAYIQAVSNSERNGKVLNIWSKANTPNDVSGGFRHINIIKSFTKYEANDTMLFDVSIKTDSDAANTSFTSKYIPKNSTTENFMEMITLAPGRNLMFFSKTIGKYNLNEWHRYTVVVDVVNELADLYIDGIKVVTDQPVSNVSYFTQVRLQQQFAFGIERNTYFDDFRAEKIYAKSNYDPSSITTQLTSAVYTVQSLQIKGVTGSVTAAALKASLTKPNNDVTMGVYSADKTTLVSDTELVSEGMVVKVVSADGLSVNYYTLSNETDVGSIVTSIDGTSSDTLANGVLTAQVDVGLYGQQATLVIARYEGNKLAGIATASISASGTLTAQLTVTNAENSTVKVMVVDNLQNIQSLAVAKILNP